MKSSKQGMSKEVVRHIPHVLVALSFICCMSLSQTFLSREHFSVPREITDSWPTLYINTGHSECTNNTEHSPAAVGPPFKVYIQHKDVKHNEVFYSLVNTICNLPDRLKGTPWDVLYKDGHRRNIQFYVGDMRYRFMRNDLLAIWHEYNQTIREDCGPVFTGVPKDPDLTLWSTVYAHEFTKEEHKGTWLPRLNTSDNIMIIHNPADDLEDSTNLYWLTPTHRNYILPFFFPPSFTKRRFVSGPLPFIVQGNLVVGHRNVESIEKILRARNDAKGDNDFRIRILGDRLINKMDKFPESTQEVLLAKNRPKVDEVSNANHYQFMNSFLDASAMLFLIDETNFHTAVLSGTKLTSSLSWAIGFGLNLVIYEDLAAVFGITRDNETACIYNHSSYILEAFDECIIKGNRDIERQRQVWNL